MDQTLLKDIPVEADYEIAHLLRVSGMELKKSKKGKYYLSFNVADSSLSVNWNKKWDSSQEEYDKLKKHKVLFITGKTNIYNDRLSIVADSMAIPEEGIDVEFLLDALMPKTVYDVKKLKKGIWELIQNMENKWIKKLCEAFITDPKISEKFCVVPAAVTRHHNFKHGLLEHTYRLMILAKDFVASYNNREWPGNKVYLDEDTILAACMLHDMFKCVEYLPEGGYALEGNMLAHISRGIMEIGSKTSQIDGFPEELKEILAHTVSAHHNLIEWGSPDTPCCPEAIVVHYLDDLCSKLDPVMLALNDLPEDEVWTENRVKAINKHAHRGNSKINYA